MADDRTDKAGDHQRHTPDERGRPGVAGIPDDGVSAGEARSWHEPDDPAGEISRLFERLRRGDDQALSRLLAHACKRLRRLASRMLRVHADVRRWEETGDVLQNALIRLCRALEAATPESPCHFYRLAALQVRRELLDLFRHHFGPEGQGARHDTDAYWNDGHSGRLTSQEDASAEPSSLAEWTDFRRAVESLPEEERGAVDLLWYQELTQEEAARVLKTSLRRVKRLWQSARLRLSAALPSEIPPRRAEGNR